MAQIRRDFVTTPLGQVLVRSGGAGPALFVLHNSHGSSEATLRGDFLPRLADRFQVFAPDLLASGDSDLPPHQLSIAEYATNLADVLDAFGIERARFVGFRAGAWIALEMAVSRPERVESIVLGGLSVWTPAEVAARRSVPYLRPWSIRADGSHLIEQWQARRGIGAGLTPEQLHWQFLEFLKPGPRVHEPLLACFDHDTAGRLPLVRARTLAIVPPEDGAEERLARITALLPSAETAMVARGTLMHDYDPAALLDLVLEFTGRDRAP